MVGTSCPTARPGKTLDGKLFKWSLIHTQLPIEQPTQIAFSGIQDTNTKSPHEESLWFPRVGDAAAGPSMLLEEHPPEAGLLMALAPGSPDHSIRNGFTQFSNHPICANDAPPDQVRGADPSPDREIDIPDIGALRASTHSTTIRTLAGTSVLDGGPARLQLNGATYGCQSPAIQTQTQTWSCHMPVVNHQNHHGGVRKVRQALALTQYQYRQSNAAMTKLLKLWIG
jgi:hypothetical protein